MLARSETAQLSTISTERGRSTRPLPKRVSSLPVSNYNTSSPVLNVDIPDTQMERYSVMFEKLLLPPQPTLFERRNGNATKLQPLKENPTKVSNGRQTFDTLMLTVPGKYRDNTGAFAAKGKISKSWKQACGENISQNTHHFSSDRGSSASRSTDEVRAVRHSTDHIAIGTNSNRHRISCMERAIPSTDAGQWQDV